MEKLIYEAKPYFYLFAAVAALISGKGSTLMTLSGLLIGISGISVIMLRYDGRIQMENLNRKMKSPKPGNSDHYGQKTYHI